MKQNLTLIDWLRLVTLSNSSARTRFVISGMAALAEFLIFLVLFNDWFDSQINVLAWCWILVLNVGLTSGAFALSGARSWSDRFAALTLLAFHLFSFLVLFVIGIFQKMQTGVTSIH